MGPAKNMSKKPFFEKMSVLRMFLELRECKARSNSVSEGAKYLLTPTSSDPRHTIINITITIKL